ncbi:MAG TPA: hypothetical protein VD999_07505 [Vitreimonas sp.]|nr:hypothetical protein [Vitreimonas sp.]
MEYSPQLPDLTPNLQALLQIKPELAAIVIERIGQVDQTAANILAKLNSTSQTENKIIAFNLETSADGNVSAELERIQSILAEIDNLVKTALQGTDLQ